MLSWWQHWDANNSTSAPQGALNIYDQLKSDYGKDLTDYHAGVGIDWWLVGANHSGRTGSVFTKGGGAYYLSIYSSTYETQADYFIFHDSFSDPLISALSATSMNVVGLGLGKTNDEEAGHSITLWGIEYDDTSQVVSKIYVTDSDDYSGGLKALSVETKEDHAMLTDYGDGCWYLYNYVTFGLKELNENAGGDPNAGFSSNTYVMDPLSLAGNQTGTAPTQTKSSEGLGDVMFSEDVSYSTSGAVSLYAKAEGEYLKIGNVTVEPGVNLSLTNASIEAAGNVTADTATLSLDSATFSGAKVTLTGGTVEMKNGVVESTNERGSATKTTFKGTGTIKNMTITGGSLISGNSPGLMTLSGDQLATVELSFYLGAGENQEMVGAGKGSKIVLNTTLGSGVLEGTETKVSSGFLLTQGTTLSGDITLSVWNDGESFSVYSGDAVYFSEGSYIQVIAFGEGVTYRDVLGVNFKLDSSISDKGDMSLMAVSDYTSGATWKKQVRTDGVYLVLSALPVYDVPEPATGVLVLTGLGLLLRRRRRG